MAVDLHTVGYVVGGKCILADTHTTGKLFLFGVALFLKTFPNGAAKKLFSVVPEVAVANCKFLLARCAPMFAFFVSGKSRGRRLSIGVIITQNI